MNRVRFRHTYSPVPDVKRSPWTEHWHAIIAGVIAILFEAALTIVGERALSAWTEKPIPAQAPAPAAVRMRVMDECRPGALCPS